MRLPILLALAFSTLVSGCSLKKTVLVTGSAGGDISMSTEQPELDSNVADVYYGDPLPAPTVVTGVDAAHPIFGLFLAAEGDTPTWLKDDPGVARSLYPAYDGQLDGKVFTVRDPIVTPGTGTFRLYVPEVFTTKPFTVTGRQPAYVQCLDANVLAGAAMQDPPSFRGKLRGCTMTRGGGDTVGKTILHATCTGPKGTSDCDYSPTLQACTGAAAPMAERRAPGDVVTMSWSGGDVPSGSATATVPATIDVGAVPASQDMSSDLELTFTGGVAGGTFRMTLTQDVTGSLVTVDCDVDAAAGHVTLPKEVFTLLEPGDAHLLFTNFGVQHVRAAEWEVEAAAMGLVTQGGTLFSQAFPLKLHR